MPNGASTTQKMAKKTGYAGVTTLAVVLPNDVSEGEKEVLVGLTEELSNKKLAETPFFVEHKPTHPFRRVPIDKWANNFRHR